MADEDKELWSENFFLKGKEKQRGKKRRLEERVQLWGKEA